MTDDQARDRALRPEMRDLLEEFPVEKVVDEAVAEVRTVIPAFRDVEPVRMRDDIVGALDLARQVLQHGVDRGGLESTSLRAIGALRAEQGLDMDDMLGGFRIVARISIDTALELARSRGIDADVTLDFTRSVWVHCDEAARELAAGYRSYVDDPARRPRRPGDVALRRLLRAGGLPPEMLAATCADLGLDPEERYRLVVTRADAEEPKTDGRSRLLAHYVDLSDRRLVGVVKAPPLAPWSAPLAYGDLLRPAELHTTLPAVLEAWQVADAFDVRDPQTPDELLLLRAVLTQPTLGDEMVERAFGHLGETRLDGVAQTLRAWFAAQGSTELAAEQLFVHRNTLRYRLRVFTEGSGLDLDRPEDAFTVWWALRRLDLLARDR
ncbi:MAG: helix-turn-helix domain-containing protein [Nocardioidaceae bacterium]|nr:helix-turn-helix domain-containing protein [Nocardioidaceae bacterium]NUS52080.1 helix-turn-helix domain-containing protein [Nocardioidaceae bacterium]